MALRRVRRAVLALVVLPLLAVVAAVPPAAAATGDISRFAGNWGEGPATGIAQRPTAVAARGSKVYIGSESLSVIRELDTVTGRQRVIAGNGSSQSSLPGALGDGGSARAASLGWISALAVDAAGNVYAADSTTFRIRKITPAGTITIVAGNGTEGDVGDGGPAREASLGSMRGLAVDGAGNLYIADWSNRRVRKVDTSGIITTVAGDGTFADGGNIGDGGPAVLAPVTPWGVAVDAAGRLYFGDLTSSTGGRVRTVSPGGTISTVAGGGELWPGSGVPALSADLSPTDLAFGPDGSLYVADVYFVSKVDLVAGRVSVFAGKGGPGPFSDGIPAVQAYLGAPQRVTVDGNGNVYIGDSTHHRVRKVDAAGILTTAAGTGYYQFAGDGGPATSAMLHQPRDLLVDPSGNVLVADQYNQRIRLIDRTGTIRTVAGSGDTYAGYSGDGGPATSARLSYPTGIALDQAGSLYIAEDGMRIRKVSASGTISTLVTLPKTLGAYSRLVSVAVDKSGNVFAGQEYPGGVWKVNTRGEATVLVGQGLHRPEGLAVDAAGNLFIADQGVRKVDPTGVATRVAVGVSDARDVTLDAAGNLIVAEGSRVRRVDRAGRISTLAGTGEYGSSGDGGPATRARLSAAAVAVRDGEVLVADRFDSQVIRRIEGVDRLPPQDTVRAWGWNTTGQLGDGSVVDRKTPTVAIGLRDARATAAGALHTLAVRSDGSVWAWGWNGVGQLGSGGTADRRSPGQVPGLTGVAAVAAGSYHSLAVRADGSVWAWGWNVAGQVGDGTTQDRAAPVRVAGLDGVVAVAAGAYHSVALKSDGTVWTWGWNGVGQLGIGSTVDSRVPVRVPGLTGIATVAAGANHTLAGGAERGVWTWGWNGVGQLGLGHTTSRTTANLVPDLYSVAKIAAGGHHTVVARYDQSVVAWGWNVAGQLGDGTTTNRAHPVPTVGAESLVSLSAGLAHTLIA